jgi:hypothetical protein
VQWLHGVVVSLVTRGGVVLSVATRVGRGPHGGVLSLVTRVGRGLLPTRMHSCAHDFVACVSVLMVKLYKERPAVGLLALISAVNLDGAPSCCTCSRLCA